MNNPKFWQALDALVLSCEIVIDRPKGSSHPRFADFAYPLDYGYLKGTQSMDGGGIDIWRGSSLGAGIVAIVITVDSAKNDAEIKILLDCSEDEIMEINGVHNRKFQKGLLVRRCRT